MEDILIPNDQSTSQYYVDIYDDLSIKESVPYATLKIDYLENNFGSTISRSSDGLKFAVSLRIKIKVNGDEQLGSWYGLYIYL